MGWMDLLGSVAMGWLAYAVISGLHDKRKSNTIEFDLTKKEVLLMTAFTPVEVHGLISGMVSDATRQANETGCRIKLKFRFESEENYEDEPNQNMALEIEVTPAESWKADDKKEIASAG